MRLVQEVVRFDCCHRETVVVASCHTILSKDLKMHCGCQHIVIRMLTQEHGNCVRINGELSHEGGKTLNFSDGLLQVMKSDVSYTISKVNDRPHGSHLLY